MTIVILVATTLFVGLLVYRFITGAVGKPTIYPSLTEVRIDGCNVHWNFSITNDTGSKIKEFSVTIKDKFIELPNIVANETITFDIETLFDDSGKVLMAYTKNATFLFAFKIIGEKQRFTRFHSKTGGFKESTKKPKTS
ncbi:MAG: hypothetical protein EOO88_00290 [Pedobacter sp.]|nr:MAG: hypothetical protein EOO88_00290 [Pedobacter sp.]